MKSATDTVFTWIAATAVLSLTACGGGGGGQTPGASASTPNSSGPAPVAVTSAGVITGFGSVWVNGVRYDTSEAEIEFEDEGRKDEDDLRLGMKVRIEATREGESRRANRIEFDEDLKGPASQVSPDADSPGTGTFMVARQLVQVDSNTVFDNDVGDANRDGSIDIRDLDPALGTAVVEISGFPMDNGFLATRVDRADTPGPGNPSENEVEVKGFVTGIDGMNGTFQIGDLTVHYGQEDLDSEDFPDGTLSAGIFAEVKGDLRADGALEASRIEREDDLLGDDEPEGEFELEGVLQAADTDSNPDTVTVNGQTIRVDDASGLAGNEGRRVEIKGTFDANGVLMLRGDDSGVEFEREDTVRIQDRVETVGTNSFFTRLGVEITPTGNSRVEDDVADDGDRLTPSAFLNRIANNDYIEARGFPESDGSVIWTRIERDDDDDATCRLRGPVEADSIDDPFFVIQGVTIDSSRITSFGSFRAANDAGIGREAFFRQLSAGDVVQAHSVASGDGCTDRLLIAAQLEFELDDGLAGNNPPAGDGNGDEIAGTVSNVNDADNTFVVAGRTVQVTNDTLIDASIVEAARRTELPGDDLRFGDLPESLSQLLPAGLAVSVQLDAQGNAILIEDQ